MCRQGPDDSWAELSNKGKMHMIGKGWYELVENDQKYEECTVEFERRDRIYFKGRNNNS